MRGRFPQFGLSNKHSFLKISVNKKIVTSCWDLVSVRVARKGQGVDIESTRGQVVGKGRLYCLDRPE